MSPAIGGIHRTTLEVIPQAVGFFVGIHSNPADGGTLEEEKAGDGGVSFPRVALRLPWAVVGLLLQSNKECVRIR